MGLWRRIVAVLAGSMIAAGGVVATLAVSELTAPASPSGVPTGTPPTLDVQSARLAVRVDTDNFESWLTQVSQRGSPTADERLGASLGAQAVADLAYGPYSRDPYGERTAGEVLQAVPEQQAFNIVQEALNVTGAPGPVNQSDSLMDAQTSTAVVLAYSTSGQVSLRAGSIVVGRFNDTRGYADTPRNETDARTAGHPMDYLALKASAPYVDPVVANWTASAAAQLALLRSEGIIGQDTLNLSLASQAIRPTQPANASAINAELRHRQAADGSFGGFRETAEAARALALGSGPDLPAAVAALNWLDGQQTPTPDQSIYRLRAHAFDNRVAPAPPPAATMPASGGFSGPSFQAPPLSSGAGKLALALWLLAGGIGLSLSLVTTDALKGARQRLYELIKGNPGLHVNELRRRLAMSPSSIEYHLAVLTGAGLVVAEDDGRYKRFYANGAGLGLNPRSPNSRNTLGALRRPHAAAIARFLVEREQGSSAREVSRTLGIHESAVARRLSHLEQAGLLVSQRNGRVRQYRVRERAAALKALDAVDHAVQLPIDAPAMAEGEEAASPSAVSVPVSSH